MKELKKKVSGFYALTSFDERKKDQKSASARKSLTGSSLTDFAFKESVFSKKLSSSGLAKS